MVTSSVSSYDPCICQYRNYDVVLIRISFCFKLSLLYLVMSSVSSVSSCCFTFLLRLLDVLGVCQAVVYVDFAFVFHGMLFPLIFRCCVGAILNFLLFIKRVLLSSTLIDICSQLNGYDNVNSFFKFSNMESFYVFFFFSILCADNSYIMHKVIKVSNLLVTYVKRKTSGCAYVNLGGMFR